MNATEMLVAVLIPLSFFAMVFGIVYMHKRENLAMIEKGLNPKEYANRPAPYRNLKWGLLLIGAGVGLFLAYLLDNYLFNHTYTYDHFNRHDGNEAIYFALIGIGGGLGLFGSYRIEKRDLLTKNSNS